MKSIVYAVIVGFALSIVMWVGLPTKTRSEVQPCVWPNHCQR